MKPSLERETDLPEAKPKKSAPMIRIRIFDEKYDAKTLRAHKDCLFLYGDNEDHVGTKGQAIIRAEPNAVGIVTKHRPYMNEDSFYDDADYETNVLAIDQSFEDLRKRIERTGMNYKFVFIPRAGLGTGLAELPQRAPKTFVYILSLIYDLAAEYDPESLESKLGLWIKHYESLVHTMKKKRLSV